MPNGVKCSVANCAFWAKGNNCSAESITVDLDKHASSFYAEFANESFDEHQDRASKSSVTCCQTFRKG